MASTRLKSLSKLALLLGVPVALLFALFAGGVYCGVDNRAAILGFEHDWLGMDVVVPATPTPTPSEPVTPVTSTPVTSTPEPAKPIPPQPVVTPTPTPVVTPEPAPKPGPAALATVTDPVPLTLASTLPLPDDLHGRMAEPVRVRVNVLVDPELVDRRPDWIAYVQRNIAWASQVLETQVGVRLELRGVSVWPGPANGQLADLQRRDRGGADLLLGFTTQGFTASSAVAPGESNLGAALVQQNPASRAPHLRGLLHAVGASLGAAAVTDPASDAARTGSFMADVSTPDSVPLALDADSRRRILERKSLPFQVSPTGQPSPDDGEL